MLQRALNGSHSQQLPGAQTLRGGMCVMVALACDAALGNYQKKVLQQGVTVQMLMLYQSLAGMAYMAVATVASGTLGSGCRLLVSGERRLARSSAGLHSSRRMARWRCEWMARRSSRRSGPW